AGALAVEQLIGLRGLIQRPAMGEQAVDVDPAPRDEVGALRLADARERPGRDQRELLAQEVAADVERDAAALADEAHRAPHLGAFDRGEAAGLGARGIESELGAAL